MRFSETDDPADIRHDNVFKAVFTKIFSQRHRTFGSENAGIAEKKEDNTSIPGLINEL